MNIDKRNSMVALLGLGSVAMLPKNWATPVVNCIVLPAHAATSTGLCSGFRVEPVTGVLTIEVTDTQVRGPVVAPRNVNDFAVTVNEVVDPIGLSVTNVDQRTIFTGSIDLATNTISGDLNVLQTCDGQLVCEQIATFSTSLTSPVMANAEGQYDGTLTGELTCCEDFI